MNQPLKFYTIPKSFWDSPQLSLCAKAVALAIDSYCGSPLGVSMGVRAIQTATNLTAKEVKDALMELKEKGALEVSIDQDGQKLLKVFLYKPEYKKLGEPTSFGDTPSDISAQIDYVYIQEQWNSICHMLPKIEKLTPHRKAKVRSCLKSAGASVEDLIRAFKLVASSSFLNGTKDSGWCCRFDWIIKSPDNFTKIIEGQYHKDYGERRAFETIMQGGEVSQKQDPSEDFYR